MGGPLLGATRCGLDVEQGLMDMSRDDAAGFKFHGSKSVIEGIRSRCRIAVPDWGTTVLAERLCRGGRRAGSFEAQDKQAPYKGLVDIENESQSQASRWGIEGSGEFAAVAAC